MKQSTVTTYCEAQTCPSFLIVKADTMEEAVAAIRKSGWSIAHHGPGHGWIARCRQHQEVGR